MIDRGRLRAVREATEYVREGMLANARGERALDMGAALLTLCDAVDKLVEAVEAPGLRVPEESIPLPPTVAHPPPAAPGAARCESTLETEGLRCELDRGHPGRHRARRGSTVEVQWGLETNAGDGGKEHRCT